MRRLFTVILVCFVAIAAEQTSFAQLGRLHFGSYKITGISPRSLRSVDGSVQISCVNDSLTFTMSNIKGVVYKKGRPFVHGSANPLTISKGSSTVVVRGNATLYDDISLWDVLSCIAFRASDYTIDVSMTITNSAGVRRQYSKSGISVDKLLRNIR